VRTYWDMHGTFNTVQLRRITSLKITSEPSGFTHTSFRIMEGPLPKLEQILRLNAPALLILSDQTIEGTIVQYSADLHHGYEVMIESKTSEGV